MKKYKNFKIITISMILIMMATIFNSNNSIKSKIFNENIKTTDNIKTILDNMPSQVNTHIGSNPSNEMNLSFTTNLKNNKSTILIKELDKETQFTIESISDLNKNNKYYHKVNIKNLKPNTRYNYTINYENSNFKGGFKTAPTLGSKNKFKFTYLADTQVSDVSDAKAVGATFSKLDKNMDFLFLAGDIIDKSTNEKSWEMFFQNNGLYPYSTSEILSNIPISVVQGNHDNKDFSDHILVPQMIENAVYSFDYGPAKFIMLNFENIKENEFSFNNQKDFLIKEIENAKKNNQWIFVGFHKSIYTGASHIVDNDIIKIRKYWAPILANLDVDFVMQGHDHVYSRGFINNKGNKVDTSTDKHGNIIDPSNAPLYIVGGHAGGLKWYPKKMYSTTMGDPLLEGYKFLDINSNDNDGDKKKEQTFIELEVSDNMVIINTYMFKYDMKNDILLKDKYLYDSIAVIRNNNKE